MLGSAMRQERGLLFCGSCVTGCDNLAPAFVFLIEIGHFQPFPLLAPRFLSTSTVSHAIQYMLGSCRLSLVTFSNTLIALGRKSRNILERKYTVRFLSLSLSLY